MFGRCIRTPLGEPKGIVVDYADLLKTLSARREKREELESTYEELRSIMMEHNVVGWTASQTNRTGLQAEIITMQSIDEAKPNKKNTLQIL